MKELDDLTYDSFIESGLVCLDFYADWCASCHNLSKVLGRLEEKFKNIKFARIDVDHGITATTEFSVASIPTLILFKNGQRFDRIEWLKSEKAIEERLKGIGADLSVRFHCLYLLDGNKTKDQNK